VVSYYKNKFINYEYSNFPEIIVSPVTISKIGYGTFVRYTHKLNSTFFITGQFEFETYNQLYRVEQSNIETKQKPLRIELMPQIGINIYKNFCLNFDMGGFLYSKSNGVNGNVEYNGYEFNFGKVINIGISKNIFVTKKRQ
jgi:hypothetical protein